MLREFAKSIRARVYSKDVVCHYGGEDFGGCNCLACALEGRERIAGGKRSAAPG